MKTNSSTFEVKENEYFYNLEIIGPTPSAIRANVPKLMPLIPKGDPTITKEGISDSIFCNHSDCKPKVNKTTISVQNFITIPKHKHQQPNFSEDLDILKNTRINKYHKFIADILHGDIRQIYISTK